MTAEGISRSEVAAMIRQTSVVTSDNMEEFWKAWVVMQGDLQPVAKDRENTYSDYKYATFDSLVETVRPTLAEHGFGFTQHVFGDSANTQLTTIIVHKSGQFMSSVVGVPSVVLKATNVAQQLGAGIQYMRRYALSAILGLSTEDDSDGVTPQELRQRQAERDGESVRREAAAREEESATRDSREGQGAYIEATQVAIRRASSGKVYQDFMTEDGEKHAAWWAGREELVKAMPWIGEVAGPDALHKVGDVYAIAPTKVSGTIDRRGYLQIKEFEKLGELKREDTQQWKAFIGTRYILTNNYPGMSVPDVPEDLPLEQVAALTAALKTAIAGIKQGKVKEKAQDWLNSEFAKIIPNDTAPSQEPESVPDF